MTTETAPAASPDPTPSTPAPEPAATPAAPAAPDTTDRSPAARRARAEAAVSTPAPSRTPTETTPVAPAEPEPEKPATPSREETVAKRLAEQRTAREAKQQAEAQRRQEHEAREWQRKVAERQTQPTAQEMLAELERDPIGARRKYGIDPRKDLDRLTQEMLSPGTSAHGATAEQIRAEAKATAERLAALENHLAQRDQHARLNANNDQFISATADAKRWPNLSKLDPADRLDEGLDAWGRLQADGADYDADLVADAAEARLERRLSKLQPAAAPKVEPPAAVKRARTITPALASDTGAPINLTREQRKARIVTDLERATQAKNVAKASSS